MRDPCITRNARGVYFERETEQSARDIVLRQRDLPLVLNDFFILVAVGVDVDATHRFVSGDIVAVSYFFPSAVDADALYLPMTSHKVVHQSSIVSNCNSN